MHQAQMENFPAIPGSTRLARLDHVLVVLPAAPILSADCPEQKLLLATLARRGETLEVLRSEPLLSSTSGGGLRVWLMLDEGRPTFEQLTLLRKGAMGLLDEHPEQVDVLLLGEPEFRLRLGELVAYVVLANGSPLPHVKQKLTRGPLQKLVFWGLEAGPQGAPILAEANLLARALTILPPNALTPATYRQRIAEMAEAEGWVHEEYDLARLQQMGAGAFLAVAQGSSEGDGAIVRLTYQPSEAVRTVALVGKGICFDTGGHNLKAARHMQGMHEDMAGSATALGLLLAVSRLGLPLRVDVWLALARNELSAVAYRPGDLVAALNGTTIEVVHTDAEGRMVLADTLALAVRESPDLLVDFATLTGSMVTALGNRYSGVFASHPHLARQAVEAGQASGERVCLFPLDEDYDAALESRVADVKQCTLEGDADHILAARFLQRFVGDTPWLHLDMAAATCKGGLGAIATEQTGFGVLWGLGVLEALLVQVPDSMAETGGIY